MPAASSLSHGVHTVRDNSRHNEWVPLMQPRAEPHDPHADSRDDDRDAAESGVEEGEGRGGGGEGRGGHK